MVVLSEGETDPVRLELALLVRLHEPAAVVPEGLWVDQHDVWKVLERVKRERHRQSFSRMIAKRYCAYGFPFSGAARRSTWAAPMKPMRYATSSIAPTFSPSRCSSAAT